MGWIPSFRGWGPRDGWADSWVDRCRSAAGRCRPHQRSQNACMTDRAALPGPRSASTPRAQGPQGRGLAGRGHMPGPPAPATIFSNTALNDPFFDPFRPKINQKRRQCDSPVSSSKLRRCTLTAAVATHPMRANATGDCRDHALRGDRALIIYRTVL
jgi:hypothetical protein